MKLQVPFYASLEGRGYGVRVTNADVSMVDGEGYLTSDTRNSVLSFAEGFVRDLRDGIRRSFSEDMFFHQDYTAIRDKAGWRITPCQRSLPGLIEIVCEDLADSVAGEPKREEVRVG